MPVLEKMQTILKESIQKIRKAKDRDINLRYLENFEKTSHSKVMVQKSIYANKYMLSELQSHPTVVM